MTEVSIECGRVLILANIETGDMELVYASFPRDVEDYEDAMHLVHCLMEWEAGAEKEGASE